MDKFSKGIAPLFAILIIAVFAVAVGTAVYYYSSNNRQVLLVQQNNQQQVTPIPRSPEATGTPVLSGDLGAPTPTPTQKQSNQKTPCGINLQVQGGTISATECYIQAVTGGETGVNSKQGFSYSLVIFDRTAPKYLSVGMNGFNPQTGGNFSLSSTKNDLSGAFSYTNQKLISGTITAVPQAVGNGNFNIVFDLSFEGGIRASGSGVFSLKYVFAP